MEMQVLLENRTYKLNHFKNLNVNFLIIAWRGFTVEIKENQMKWVYMKMLKVQLDGLKTKGINEKSVILVRRVVGHRSCR